MNEALGLLKFIQAKFIYESINADLLPNYSVPFGIATWFCEIDAGGMEKIMSK